LQRLSYEKIQILSEKTIKSLYAKLAKNNIIVNEFCTDNWKAFAKTLPKNKHKIGKQYTKAIKENNNYLRSRNRRAVCKSCGFSKKLENHEAIINIYIYCKNYNHYCKKYHIFFTTTQNINISTSFESHKQLLSENGLNN
jgi:IS1 family transposase